jgi:hypothetical protein
MKKENLNTPQLIPLDIVADLGIEHATGSVKIKADGQKMIVTGASLWSAINLLVSLKKAGCSTETLKAVDGALKRIDVTLAWKSSHFGVLGKHSKNIFRMVLFAAYKILRPTDDRAPSS